VNTTTRIGLVVPSSNTTMETEIPQQLRRRRGSGHAGSIGATPRHAKCRDSAQKPDGRKVSLSSAARWPRSGKMSPCRKLQTSSSWAIR
jgi:hypothetical protein